MQNESLPHWVQVARGGEPGRVAYLLRTERSVERGGAVAWHLSAQRPALLWGEIGEVSGTSIRAQGLVRVLEVAAGGWVLVQGLRGEAQEAALAELAAAGVEPAAEVAR